MNWYFIVIFGVMKVTIYASSLIKLSNIKIE